MISIYHDFLFHQETPSIVFPGKESEHLKKMFQIAKSFLKNAKLAAENFLSRKLSKFDPIVHDNSCQIRVSFVLRAAKDTCLQEEMAVLKKKAAQLLAKVNRLQDIFPSSPSISFEELIKQTGIELTVSKDVDYLLRAHLLTVGKEFSMTREGREVARIILQNMCDVLCKSAPRDSMERIISIAREILNRQSILYIQTLSQEISHPLAEGKKISEELANEKLKAISFKEKSHALSLTLSVSCTFYNFKAVLLDAFENQTLILIKEYLSGKKGSPLGLYYRSPHAKGQPVLLSEETQQTLNKEEAVFVIQGFIPLSFDKKQLISSIEEQGLLQIALVNAAIVPQYSQTDDIECLSSEGKKEIERYKHLGRSLGCGKEDPKVFKIVHTYASSVKEERVV